MLLYQKIILLSQHIKTYGKQTLFKWLGSSRHFLCRLIQFFRVGWGHSFTKVSENSDTCFDKIFSGALCQDIPVIHWSLESLDDRTDVLSINTSQSAETPWNCMGISWGEWGHSSVVSQYLTVCIYPTDFSSEVTPEEHYYTKYPCQQICTWDALSWTSHTCLLLCSEP